MRIYIDKEFFKGVIKYKLISAINHINTIIIIIIGHYIAYIKFEEYNKQFEFNDTNVKE